ncbi:MAG TPA: hypothetical protein VEL74_07940 [Thermoanaerobaculia bacterium]|nr:hypothetical protein [Thermoanaerobaculia bacterium]
MTPTLASGGAGRRDLWVSLLIGLCCLLVYNANRRAISSGDAYPARYLPFAIWQHHTVLLDPIAPVTNQGRGGTAHWMVPQADGRIVSLYPVTLPVLISPLYLPAVAYLRLEGWTERRLDHVARIMEKLAASFVAALSAALLYLLLRRRVTVPTALLLTIAYAFGTTTWVISSQALWQHGMAELLLVGALLCLTAPCTTPRALAAGLLCGLVAANRPPDLILAAALGAYGLFWAGRRAPRLAALIGAAALPMVLALAYNLAVADHFAGGYGRVGKATFFEHDLLSGLAGLLFSPTRGLFVFSPFLLFLVLAWRYRPRGPLDRDERGLTLAISIGVVLQLLLYAKTDWRTGISWGPRYLTDLLPLLVWLLAPVVAALRGFGRALFVLAVGAAVVIQAIGAFWYTGVTDAALYAVTSGPHRMRAAWDWRNAPFVASLQHGLAPAELMFEVRGSFDAIETAGGPAFAVSAGQEAYAAGWALAGDAAPWQVGVLIDGRLTAVSRSFHDRPDVRAALNEASPAGWRVPVDTAGLAPGKHRVAVLAWAFENGAGHYLGEHELTVRTAGEELEDGFKTAAARLRARQQGPGYWLTTHTITTRFQQPLQEMNTYLTALLIDLLEPLASTGAPGDLGDSLRRARRHLTEQIEAGGLVRYHGLPDAPGIGTLGCAITPDSDDTALAWRIAPSPDRRRLPAALATLDRYRTREGLYRTWLAPVEDYRCLNPGSDPNPADLTIQMHVLLMLAEERPAAGRALCEALRPVVDQDRVWVYYRRAPLVPILRLPDLRRAGCDLELPESRMRTEVEGQEIWVSAARLLARAPASADRSADAAEARAVLRRLAQDDFALLRESPPLLYHNDLTASVSRYYWSEDVGYALWLRLYHEYSHPGHPPLAG